MVTRASYRVRQFTRALGARPAAVDLDLLDIYLSPAERRLFVSTSPRDQQHQIATLQLLQARGPVPRYLARAALLHDIGKGRIRLYERVAYVLLAAVAPGMLARLAACGHRGPLGALYRIHHHAEIGAAALRTLGADPREVELVARHHQPPGDDTELRALIAADDEA